MRSQKPLEIEVAWPHFQSVLPASLLSVKIRGWEPCWGNMNPILLQNSWVNCGLEMERGYTGTEWKRLPLRISKAEAS